MTDSPVIPRHNLDHSNVVKIRLSAAASDALRDVGEYHLAVISRADCTAPAEVHGRMVLHVIALTKELATAVSGVALGTHTARRIKAATPPQPLPPASIPQTSTDAAQANVSASPPNRQ
jgi:hypothetical protein